MNRKTFYFDLLERTVWTFLQGFAGGYVGGLFSDAVTDLPTNARLSIALGAGLVAVMKGVIVNQLPWTAANSASTLPAEVDPPNEDGRVSAGFVTAVASVAMLAILIAWAWDLGPFAP